MRYNIACAVTVALLVGWVILSYQFVTWLDDAIGVGSPILWVGGFFALVVLVLACNHAAHRRPTPRRD